MRLTILCPEAHIEDANHLAMVGATTLEEFNALYGAYINT